MKISHKVAQIRESGTVQFTPLVQRLKAEGRGIIDFSVGEPFFPTPAEVIRATQTALAENRTRYDAVAGLDSLRDAILDDFRDLSFSRANVVISNGSKQSLYSVFQTICNAGDEVIIPAPYWPTFPEQVRLAGGVPVIVSTTSDFRIDVAAMQKAVSARTVAIVINSPNNPTGAVYARDDLEAVIRLAEKFELYLVFDAAYEFLRYDDLPPTAKSLFRPIRDRIIAVHSFSKSYSMTGFRVGYVVADDAVAAGIRSLQGHLTGNVCTFAQYGALAALQIDQTTIRTQIQVMQAKRDLVYKLASELFICPKPQGAFYIFPDVTAYLTGPLKSSADLSCFLLEKAGVATVPGEVFGTPQHIRISYAVADSDIREGFQKIAEVL